jgi:hypothetical protein
VNSHSQNQVIGGSECSAFLCSLSLRPCLSWVSSQFSALGHHTITTDLHNPCNSTILPRGTIQYLQSSLSPSFSVSVAPYPESSECGRAVAVLTGRPMRRSLGGIHPAQPPLQPLLGAWYAGCLRLCLCHCTKKMFGRDGLDICGMKE